MVGLQILVIEDDPLIGRAVQQGIREANHDCSWVKDGRNGLDLALSQRFDAIVLDLLIPALPGMVLLQKLRSEGIKTPVLILTALGSIEDRVKGLHAGADDYVVKPFALPELLARIDALCRRAGPKPAVVVQAGELILDLATRRLTRGGVQIDLTPTEFSICELLMRHAGQVVTRKMLCESLWESDWEGTTNVIEVHMNRLRGKVQRVRGNGSREQLIRTVRGRGYSLVT
jgi:two-component system OmpR family response regulator/two-component system copper resistance phosphate regulon response regulator CusR